MDIEQARWFPPKKEAREKNVRLRRVYKTKVKSKSKAAINYLALHHKVQLHHSTTLQRVTSYWWPMNFDSNGILGNADRLGLPQNRDYFFFSVMRFNNLHDCAKETMMMKNLRYLRMRVFFCPLLSLLLKKTSDR